MKKLWVNWLLLFISIATAEKSNDTIERRTGNELNCTTRECVKDNLEFDPGIKNHNLEFLKEIISKFGGWPVVEGHKWNETNDNWTNFIDEATKTGFIYDHFHGLRTLSIENRTTIFFQPLSLEFSQEVNKNQKIRRTSGPYLKFIVKVANFLGANKTQAEKELAPSVVFEMKLTHISEQNIASSLNNKDNSMELSVKEVIENWPSIGWIKLLRIQSDLPSNITNETVVFIENTDIITKLENLVKNTTARVRANYAMWKTIQGLIPLVESAFLSRLLQSYTKIKNPLYVDEPVNCFAELKNNFRELMVAYYGRNYPVDKLTRSHAHPFISNIKHKFFDTFNSTKWLDMKTRDTLFETINSLKFIIGYPDEIMDDNQLVLGVELLRNLFFSVHRPSYINIAVLGRTLAHEIGHSIDYSYNNDINSEVNDSKWTESSKQVYRDVRECIAQQYSNYSRKVTGKEMNGEFYLVENIADNIGSQVAYSAYQDWVKTHGPQPTFSSLPYNSNQLFWLSLANPWCSPKSTLQNWGSTDKHPSDAHRTIIPLFNSPEFSKDFNCPLGSNMNPVKKCIVF